SAAACCHSPACTACCTSSVKSRTAARPCGRSASNGDAFGYCIPPSLDLSDQPRHLVERLDAVLHVGLEQGAHRVVVQPLQVLRELAAAFEVEAQQQPFR